MSRSTTGTLPDPQACRRLAAAVVLQHLKNSSRDPRAQEAFKL